MVDAQFDQHGTFRRVCRTSCGTTSASARVQVLAEEHHPAQVQDRLEEWGRGRSQAAVPDPVSAAVLAQEPVDLVLFEQQTA